MSDDLISAIDAIAQRASFTLFRIGQEGYWRQVSGSLFLNHILQAQRENSYAPEDAIHLPETGYAALVTGLAAMWQGAVVSFGCPNATPPPNTRRCQPTHIHWHMGETSHTTPTSRDLIHSEKGGIRASSQYGEMVVSGNALVEAARILLNESALLATSKPSTSCYVTSLLGWGLPLSHALWLSAALTGSACGIPDPQACWETNLRILRPSMVLLSSNEVDTVLQPLRLRTQQNPLWKGRTLAARLTRKLGVGPRIWLREVFENLETILMESTMVVAGDETALRQCGLRVIRIDTDKFMQRVPASAAARRDSLSCQRPE